MKIENTRGKGNNADLIPLLEDYLNPTKTLSRHIGTQVGRTNSDYVFCLSLPGVLRYI